MRTDDESLLSPRNAQRFATIAEFALSSYNSIPDRIAFIEEVPGGAVNREPRFVITYCNDAFFHAYKRRPLIRGESSSIGPLSALEVSRGPVGVVLPPVPVDLAVLYQGDAHGPQFPPVSSIVDQLITRQHINFYVQRAGKTSALLISRLGRRTTTGSPRRSFLLSERDTSQLFGLINAVETWMDRDNTEEVCAQIVKAFGKNGILSFFGLSFCRLWLYDQPLSRFVSFKEFGLKHEAHRKAFKDGRVEFAKDDWLKHAVNQGEMAIYEEQREALPNGLRLKRSTHNQGFPFFMVSPQEWPAELEISQPHRWVDAPLHLGGYKSPTRQRPVIGCISCSVPRDLTSGTWELLNLAFQAAGLAIGNALLRDDKDLWLRGVQHALNTSVATVFGLINTALRLDPAAEASDLTECLELAYSQEELIRLQRKKFYFGVLGESYNPRAESEDILGSLKEIVAVVSETLPAIFESEPRPKLTLNPCLNEGTIVETAPISTDHVEVKSVILELIKNALEGDGVSDVRPTQVMISPRISKGDLLVEISDDGVGIDETKRARLFSRRLVSRKATGMGVGLYMCHSVVDLLGGKLECLNPDLGACFRLTLPLERDVWESSIMSTG